jgi:RNase P/RNase MRP subunit p30
MAQNIVFCRKFKVPTLIASFARTPFELRNPSDLASFFTVLGMHPEEAKKALGLR